MGQFSPIHPWQDKKRDWRSRVGGDEPVLRVRFDFYSLFHNILRTFERYLDYREEELEKLFPPAFFTTIIAPDTIHPPLMLQAFVVQPLSTIDFHPSTSYSRIALVGRDLWHCFECSLQQPIIFPIDSVCRENIGYTCFFFQ